MECNEVPIEDIKFIVNQKRIVHGETSLVMDKSPVPLFVISPDHGKVKYLWERKRVLNPNWITINVPTWTCLLYVDEAASYRCSFGDTVIVFEVKPVNPKKSCKSDDLNMEMDDVVVLEEIGRGCFSVHKGLWKGQVVAIKRIPIPAGVSTEEMLKGNKEIAALRLLKHPNIVSLLGYTLCKKELMRVMHFVDGENLDSLIFGRSQVIGKMTKQQQFFICSSIANGIEYMHTRRPVVIHRDIKPLNVMLTNDHKGVFICDMGIANIKDISTTSMTTSSTSPRGTYPYMAPELFSKGHRGIPVDVYAFGCLMIEVFGQVRVWSGLNGPQIMQKVCGTFICAPMAPLVTHLPAPISEICADCCNLEAKKRPPITSITEILKKKLA